MKTIEFDIVPESFRTLRSVRSAVSKWDDLILTIQGGSTVQFQTERVNDVSALRMTWRSRVKSKRTLHIRKTDDGSYVAWADPEEKK